MAEEVEKNDGWGIYDRLKNLPHLNTVKGHFKRTPVKTSSQTENNEDELDVQEVPAPKGQQGDLLMSNLTVKQDEHGEGGMEAESATDDVALSNRDLLNQLQAVAVGIRDFEALGAKPKLTQLVGEVKDKRVRVKKSSSDNSTKSKAKESSENKLSTSTKASSKASSKATSKATSKAILKAASKVRKGIIVKESKARAKLAFSDSYLEKAFGLTNITQLSEEVKASPSVKKSTNDSLAKKSLKSKTLTKKQLPSLSIDGIIKSVKKEVRQRELEWDSEDELPPKKKAKVSAKSTVNQRLRVLPHEKRVLPEPAFAEVVASKEEREAAATEMTKLLDEIRGMKKDNVNDLPSDVTERWISAHVTNLRKSFNFHSTIIRHTLGSITPKLDP